MNEEIKNTLDEMRSAFDAKMQKLEEQQKSLEAREFEIAQKEARANAPVSAPVETMEVRDAFLKADAEKRAVTLGGTGATKLVNALVEKIEESNTLVSKASFFRGRDAATKISCVNPGPARPSKAAEGATGLTGDSQMALTACEVDPYAWFSEVAVSAETLKFNPVFGAKLPAIMAKSFSQAMGTAMMTGTGASNSMKGIFVSVPSGNKTTCAAAGAPTRAELKAFAVKLKAKEFEEPCIIMSDVIYSAITAPEPTGYDPVYNSLVETKPNVLGIPVHVTAKAPSTTTSGSVMVWGGELSNYAIGLADEVEISPIKTPGSTNTYFQCISFFSGKVMVEDNTYALVAHA